MAAEHERRDILDRNLEFFRQEMPEARRIEHARHADHHVVRQPRKLTQRPDHRIERIGDANHERARRIGLDALAHCLHHLQVDTKQIVAAHPRLAGYPGRHDDYIGASYIGVIIGALQVHIEPFNGAALRQVERLALRHAVDDVEQHDIAERLGRGEVRQRAADVSSADQRNFVACHGSGPSLESFKDALRIVPMRHPRNRSQADSGPSCAPCPKAR